MSSKSELFIILAELHDFEFRLNHKCKCKYRTGYNNGKYYCQAMKESRDKNSLLIKLRKQLEAENEDRT